MLKTTIKFIAENSSDFWLAPARRKIRHSIVCVCVCYSNDNFEGVKHVTIDEGER